MSTTEFSADISALEKRVKLLQHVVYVPDMSKEVTRILSLLPHPDPNHKPAKDAPKPPTTLPTFESLGRKEKIKILLLRARTNLLLPVFSADAEADLNRALKLDQTSADPLILLSECLWRKNALKEACEAIESALRIKPGAAAALCQQSRLLRSLVSSETDKAAASGNEGGTSSTNGSFTTAPNAGANVDPSSYLSGFGSPAAAIAAAALAKDGGGVNANTSPHSTPTLPPANPPGFDAMSIEERKALTDKTIELAREAVKADPVGSEAWQALGMAILFDNITNGMDMPNLKKALGAFNQAIKNNGTEINKLKEKHAEAAKTDVFIRMIQLNPDNFYNRAVVLECFAQYGSAASDYETAARLDPTGLRAALAKAKICTDIVHRFKTLTNDSVILEGDTSANSAKAVTISATTTKIRDVSQKLGSGLVGKKSAAANAGDVLMPSGPCLLTDVLDKQFTETSASDETKQSGASVSLLVVDSLTAPTAQPLVYLCCDQNKNACALLIYRVNAQAIMKGDVISVGFPLSSAYTLTQTIPSGSGKGDIEVRMPIVCVEPDMVTVNGAPIPSRAFTSTRLSTRLFQ